MYSILSINRNSFRYIQLNLIFFSQFNSSLKIRW